MYLKSILLIDDDVDEHDIFATAIKEIGNHFFFNAVPCASQAIQALKSFELKPDIIFLDLNMPGMSGEEFIAAFKDCKELHTIPLIIYSTSLTYTNKSPALQGVKYALKKPNSFHELVKSLGVILNTESFEN